VKLETAPYTGYVAFMQINSTVGKYPALPLPSPCHRGFPVMLIILSFSLRFYIVLPWGVSAVKLYRIIVASLQFQDDTCQELLLPRGPIMNGALAPEESHNARKIPTVSGALIPGESHRVKSSHA
jgi:hypothetical protein